MNKPSKNILILPIALFFMHSANAHVSNEEFLNRSSIAFGIGFSKILADSIYDQDLDRPIFGYYYNYPKTQKLDFDFGLLYNQRGGKSFNEDTYQIFAYADVPIKANYIFSDGFKMGLGIQPSYLLYNQTRKRGVRTIYDPNPHPYYPKQFDLNLIASLDLKLSQSTTLCLATSFSPSSSLDNNTKFRHCQLALQFKVDIGNTVSSIKKQSIESRKPDLDLVKLRSGYVIVLLNSRATNANYYFEKGDSATANQMLIDAQEKNQALKKAFINEFKYCNFYFTDLNNQSKLCKGDTTLVVEDKDGNELKISDLGKNFSVMFKPGSIYSNVNSFSKEGYHFLDLNCEKLDDPFPSEDFAAAGNTSDLNLMIKTLNKRLFNREESIRSKKYFSTDLLDQ